MNRYDQLWSENWQNLQQIGPLTHTRYRLMLRELPTTLQKGSRIIDVGCGNGTFLSFLAQRYPDTTVDGIEYSEQALLSAPASVRDRIQIGDVIELAPRLATTPYDLVVCSEVLEHLPDPQKAMKAIVSLMKPGGLALLTVPGGMRYWSKQDEVAGHYRRFEYDEFALLVKESGLQIEHHYGWGGPFALIYDKMIDLIGPDKVMKSGTSQFSQIISRLLILLFRIDDLFCSRNGFQLITTAKHR